MGKFEMNKAKTISLTVGAFVAGALISLHIPALAEKEVKPGLPIDELRTFAEVYSAIKQGYVEPVEDKKMITNAISGMLSKGELNATRAQRTVGRIWVTFVLHGIWRAVLTQRFERASPLKG
ncbi:MAG: hypothetical protein MK097_21855, partial [Dechloromonas sp.]|nr:hypothetical protein [Dechloromonas sp.]